MCKHVLYCRILPNFKCQLIDNRTSENDFNQVYKCTERTHKRWLTRALKSLPSSPTSLLLTLSRQSDEICFTPLWPPISPFTPASFSMTSIPSPKSHSQYSFPCFCTVIQPLSNRYQMWVCLYNIFHLKKSIV